tara:strand:+ start:773 stop:1060 length:288 start_codon:yes stop_codon:yes gene_type:complete
MYIDEKLIKLLEPHNGSKIDVSYAIRLINIVAKEHEVEQLTLTDVVDSKRFTETDLLNGYQAGCIEGLDECCDLGLNDLKEIKEYGEKWVKIYTE